MRSSAAKIYRLNILLFFIDNGLLSSNDQTEIQLALEILAERVNYS